MSAHIQDVRDDTAPRNRNLSVNSADDTAHDPSIGNRMMKVDHAGEHGAICIYSGQLFMARLFVPGMVSELNEFLSHERRHRAVFQEELQRRGYPRCRSYWLCGIGGLVLGLVTGICGRKAIVATTVAVESVVLKHLAHQLDVLGDIDPHAVAAITSIVDEEQHHHDHSAAQIDVRDPWFRILAPMVTAWTEAVIWMGMRS
ncbi:Ubiquinone biosynthesis protein COQ7 [Paucimonas lemoignei]|nr:Ubiquinone biosynthesis protein COQ7 [Paucimonas lemoignei]